jgi:hypothetical protein
MNGQIRLRGGLLRVRRRLSWQSSTRVCPENVRKAPACVLDLFLRCWVVSRGSRDNTEFLVNRQPLPVLGHFEEMVAVDGGEPQLRGKTPAFLSTFAILRCLVHAGLQRSPVSPRWLIMAGYAVASLRCINSAATCRSDNDPAA